MGKRVRNCGAASVGVGGGGEGEGGEMNVWLINRVDKVI